MSHSNGRSRHGGSPTSTRRARPALEGLEERLLMYATLGANWVYGERITYSFVPDGTSVGGTPSTLFQTMSKFPQAAWQKAFHDAAAVWQAVANVNLVQVSDNGMGLGAYGNQQGDANVGDIRIGAIVMGPTTLGAAFAPPPINGGTLAGDIVLNSTINWNINYSYDLKTVAIHEFGHALGMDHSAIYDADMYSYYVGQKQSLHSDDVGGIRSVYDARPYDAWNSNGQSNMYWFNAKSVDGWLTNLNQIKLPNLNITMPGQTEWFWITIPPVNIGSFTVRMQSSNLSLLTPAVSVYDSSLNLKGTTYATNYGDTATLTIPGVSTGQGFFIRLSPSYQGGSTGAYGMQINFGTNTVTPFQPPYTVVPSQAGTGGGFVTMTTAAPSQPPYAVVPSQAGAGGGFVAKTSDVGGELHEGLIQIGSLIGRGDALLASDLANPTAAMTTIAAPTPFLGIRSNLVDRQDVSASWRGGSWTSIGSLDDALSMWGHADDDGLPAFGKRTKGLKPA